MSFENVRSITTQTCIFLGIAASSVDYLRHHERITKEQARQDILNTIEARDIPF